MSLEICSELQVAELHVKAVQTCFQTNQIMVGRDNSDILANTERYLENLIFRPRWFPKKLILSSANELLESNGISGGTWPDGSSFHQVKIFVREVVQRLLLDVNSRNGEVSSSDSNSLNIWISLLRRCFENWKETVDDFLGVGIINFSNDPSVVLLKESAISIFREQEGLERDFFGFGNQETRYGPLLRIAYGTLEWAQDVDPGGVSFSFEMNRSDARSSLQSLLDQSIVNLSNLQPVCHPDLYFQDADIIHRLSEGLRKFTRDCKSFLDNLIVGPSQKYLASAAKEYANSQKMYVLLEIMRGTGLFLTLLNHYRLSMAIPFNFEVEA
jgi:hypothetical protein